jgi:hypothetical protein
MRKAMSAGINAITRVGKMDIEKLLQNFDPNNKQQVRALQQALQAQGYNVNPDGKMGPSTSQAIGQWRTDQTNAANRTLQGQQLEQQAKENSWQNQAIEGAKYTAIPAGIGVGYGLAKKLERRQLATEAAQRSGQMPNPAQNWSPTRRFAGRFAPYALRGGLYAGEGLALREMLAPQIENKTGRELARIIGSGVVGAGVGMAGEGIVNAFTPQATPGSPSGPSVPPPPPPQNALDAAGRANQPGALPPPDETPPAGPSGPRPHSERLIAAARAAGATGKLTKADAVKYLKKNVTDQNRGAVARALNVKSGPNLATRIGSTIKTMASTRGASSLVAPLIAAGAAYELAGEPAEAADGTMRAPGLANRLAAAGVAGGAAYGLNKLAQAAPMAGNMAGPVAAMTFDPLEGGSREESAENIRVARATAPWPINKMLGVTPEEVQTQEMSALPSPNPLRTTPEPGNQYYPLSGQTMDAPRNQLEAVKAHPDPFGIALQDFMSMVQELQAAESPNTGSQMAP